MKTRVIFFVLLISATLLTGCGEKKPSEKVLKDLIPEEVKDFYYDYELYKSEVKSLTVTRQQVNDRQCITECVVELDSSVLKRTEYLTLDTTRWDKGGWSLASWSTSQEGDYAAKDAYDVSQFEQMLLDRGYSEHGFSPVELTASSAVSALSNILTDADTDIGDSRKYQYAAYVINDVHENLTVNGALPILARLIQSSEYPREYLWSVEMDTSDVAFDWDIRGEWSGTIDFHDRSLNPFGSDTYQTKSYEINLNINDMEYGGVYSDIGGEYYCLAGEYSQKKVDADDLKRTSFGLGDWQHARVYGTTLSDIYLEFAAPGFVALQRGDYYVYIQFYPDNACLRYGWTNTFGQTVLSDDVYDFTRV